MSDKFPHHCQHCVRKYQTKDSLRRHTREKHAEVLDEAPMSDKFPHHCQQCDHKYEKKRGLQKHIRNKHGPFKPRRCPDCSDPTVWKNAGELEAHQRHKHYMTLPIASQCPLIHCVHQTYYTTRSGLKRHFSHQHSEIGNDIVNKLITELYEHATQAKAALSGAP